MQVARRADHQAAAVVPIAGVDVQAAHAPGAAALAAEAEQAPAALPETVPRTVRKKTQKARSKNRNFHTAY